MIIEGPTGHLFVDDGGAGGLPLLFVHSAAGSTRHWAAQLRHFRKTRRAAALDLRGHGRSDPPGDRNYSVRAMAGDIGAVADGLGLSRFLLVGHSMGGFVSIAYAARNPQRVAGLFLLDPASDSRATPPEQSAQLMAALQSDAYQATVEGYWHSIIGTPPNEIRDLLMEDLRQTPPETLIGTLENLLAFDPVTPLAAYPGPKLTFITALNETPASLQNLVPGLACEKINGTGHWPQLERPDEINARIGSFLAQIS